MEIKSNKAKLEKDGKTIKQEVVYDDPYEEVKLQIERRKNKAVITGTQIKHK